MLRAMLSARGRASNREPQEPVCAVGFWGFLKHDAAEFGQVRFLL